MKLRKIRHWFSIGLVNFAFELFKWSNNTVHSVKKINHGSTGQPVTLHKWLRRRSNIRQESLHSRHQRTNARSETNSRDWWNLRWFRSYERLESLWQNRYDGAGSDYDHRTGWAYGWVDFHVFCCCHSSLYGRMAQLALCVFACSKGMQGDRGICAYSCMFTVDRRVGQSTSCLGSTNTHTIVWYYWHLCIVCAKISPHQMCFFVVFIILFID